ncbi:MAG: M1 family metallopeptidase [Bacteroidia bacterium]
MKHIIAFTLLVVGAWELFAQQEVFYQIETSLDTKTHQMKGHEQVFYVNNSPDTLFEVFYHLYWNAFKPGSQMAILSEDSLYGNPRINDKISHLTKGEEGFIHVTSFYQDGIRLSPKEHETILRVTLHKPLLPGKKTKLELDWEAQVPLLVRRAGRDNVEGIDYAIAQWYPRIAGYDADGWHADPYLAREFYGPFGSFDVTITLDSQYVVGGTGTLQNPEETGHGYQLPKVKVKPSQNGKITWHFKAEKVHDFVWAADPDYIHQTIQVPNGPKVHFFFQPTDSVRERWDSLMVFTGNLFQRLSNLLSPYPYSDYSVIQGGDGGMEYPQATLITASKAARKDMEEFCRVTTHEIVHNWFQGMVATNERRDPWMDEGFTRYYTRRLMDEYFPQTAPHQKYNYDGYFSLIKNGTQTPMSRHADHFPGEEVYRQSVYAKGGVFLGQLDYILGREVFDEAMKAYIREWSFRQPTPREFKRSIEKKSGIDLDWYFSYWLKTTDTIDYAIQKVSALPGTSEKTEIQLQRVGQMPMPIDLVITYKNGVKENYTIPLQMMWASKKQDSLLGDFQTLPEWNWPVRTYRMTINHPIAEIEHIEIDPGKRMADVNRTNNAWIWP